jgi:hypothetical protein
MRSLRQILDSLRRTLVPELDSVPAALPAPSRARVEPALAPAAARLLSLEPAAFAAPTDEFADMLGELGAEPVSAVESALAVRDATIAELRARLADLSGLGERLAATERERLRLQTELAAARSWQRELEERNDDLEGRAARAEAAATAAAIVAQTTPSAQEPAAVPAAPAPETNAIVVAPEEPAQAAASEQDGEPAELEELAELRERCRRLQGAVTRAESRARAHRERADERHRIAADRWRELRAVKGERNALRRELERRAR